MSETLYVRHGIPQGSVIGPLLFIIYVNDFQNYMCDTCVLFADDTTIYSVDKNITNLEILQLEAISLATSWFTSNKLSLNADKTSLLFLEKKCLDTYHRISN